MFNRVTLIGNLGKDPEIRNTQDGRQIANLSVATSEKWKDKATGERKEKTEWHRVVCFSEGLCGIIEQYLRKGSTVYIEGKLQTRKWTDQSGIEKYTTEVVMENFGGKLLMLGGKGGRGGDDAGGGDNDFGTGEHSSPSRSSRGSTGRRPANDMDDDIPF
jgi:single-strand DNA-binding protein